MTEPIKLPPHLRIGQDGLPCLWVALLAANATRAWKQKRLLKHGKLPWNRQKFRRCARMRSDLTGYQRTHAATQICLEITLGGQLLLVSRFVAIPYVKQSTQQWRNRNEDKKGTQPTSPRLYRDL